MPVSSDLLAEIKSRQNVLICKAGLAVPSYEMSAEKIQETILEQFKHHCKNEKYSAGQPTNLYFRTSKHCDKDVSEKDFHTGLSLWRKYSSIKKYVNNMITPLFAKCLGPDGLPPSGHNMENVLLKCRKMVFDAEQQQSKAKSKNPSQFKVKTFKPTWFPVEWEVFLQFGRGSDKPEKAFFLE